MFLRQCIALFHIGSLLSLTVKRDLALVPSAADIFRFFAAALSLTSEGDLFYVFDSADAFAAGFASHSLYKSGWPCYTSDLGILQDISRLNLLH
jgi:hypothetical protein